MQPEAKHRRNYPKVLLNRESHVNGSCIRIQNPPQNFISPFFRLALFKDNQFKLRVCVNG